MGSSTRKSAFILGCALLLGADSSYAANHTVLGVTLNSTSEGITANIATKNEYTDPIKATKSGQYYNIILPNTVKQTDAPCQNSELAESCRITTMKGSDGNSYTKIQIKVPENVKVTATGSVGGLDESFSNNKNTEFNEKTERELLEALAEDKRRSESDIESHEDSFDEQAESEEPNFEDPNFNDSAETQESQAPEMLPEPEQEAPKSTYKPIDESSLSANHLQEILYGASWVVVIILVSLIIYYFGRDKIRQQMGDMNIDISDNKKKAKKEDGAENKAKEKETPQKKQSARTETIDLTDYSTGYKPPEMDTSAFEIEEDPIIDINSLYVQPTPPRTPVEESPVNAVDEDDLDDFLNSFVDDEKSHVEPESQSVSYMETPPAHQDMEQVEEESPEKESAEAVSDVYLTPSEQEETEFENTENDAIDGNDSKEISDSDNEILSVEDLLEGEDLQQILPDSDANILDENDDIGFENPIENLIDDVLATEGMSFSEADVDFIQKQLQVDVNPELLDEFRFAKQTNAPTTPLMTLEMFDEQYPALSDKAISELLNDGVKFNNVDSKVIHDLMTNLEISDDSITEARIRKEQEDQANIEYYQNEADFAFTLVKPQDLNNQDDIIVLDENYYPDLDEVDFSGDSILDEFTLIQPEKPNYTEELDLGTITPEDLGITEPIRPLISKELEEELEQRPPVRTELLDDDAKIENSSSVNDDIDAQFKAWGVDFAEEVPPEEPKEQDFSPMENPVESSSEDSELGQEPEVKEEFNSTKAEIYAKCSVDESTKLYITRYEGKNVLIGMKNDMVKPLYEFTDSTIPSSISSRVAETVDDKTRYIIRADKFKSVIEVSENDIELILVL